MSTDEKEATKPISFRAPLSMHTLLGDVASLRGLDMSGQVLSIVTTALPRLLLFRHRRKQSLQRAIAKAAQDEADVLSALDALAARLGLIRADAERWLPKDGAAA